MPDLRAICRIGDQGQGICNLNDGLHVVPLAYTTTFQTGSDTLFDQGIEVCTHGTIGQSSCGHQTIATTASSFTIKGKGIHRVGDHGHIIGDASSIYTATTGSGLSSVGGDEIPG